MTTKRMHTTVRTLTCAAAVWLAALSTPALATGDPVDAAIAGERVRGDRTQDAWRKPREVLRFLEIAPGHHVLDFFAGPGYYSELMSHIVGPTGSVLIYNNQLYTQAAHHEITLRRARGRLPNTTLLNAPTNYLKLEPASLDRVLFVLVYHDLYWRPSGSGEPMGDPQKVLSILHKALKPGGLVVVVDHAANATQRLDATRIANRMHRIDPQLVLADFEQAGFIFAGENDALRSGDDDHAASVFDPAVRRRTDRFIYKFRKADSG